MSEPGPVVARLAVGDLFDEALAGVLARPSRLAFTALGTIIGVSALVATAGLTSSAGNHIVSRFDALAATEVVVVPAVDPAAGGPAADSGTAPVEGVLPWDAEERLGSLNGVRAVGTLTPVEGLDDAARTVPVVDPSAIEQHVDVVAVSPGLIDAVLGSIGSGRTFDAGHDERGDAVAVVGRAAADRLGLAPIDRRPAVFVGDTALSVVGILDDVGRQPGLLDAILVPAGTARRSFGLTAPAAVHVDTEIGAARLVGSQAALALAPGGAERLEVRVAPEPRTTRARVADDVRALALLLGALALVIGGLGIANTTLVGVLERTSEIGLRRALGARRRDVAAQFLVESTTVGVIGGVVGVAVGVLVVVGVSGANGWTPVVDPWMPPAALAGGALIGLLAGSYPAWRAAGIEPISALRVEG